MVRLPISPLPQNYYQYIKIRTLLEKINRAIPFTFLS
jgi:hypothetical protein